MFAQKTNKMLMFMKNVRTTDAKTWKNQFGEIEVGQMVM